MLVLRSTYLIFAIIVLASGLSALPHVTRAGLNSFSVSPLSVAVDPATFTWTSFGIAGVKLVLPCQAGVSYKNTDTGTAISCGSDITNLQTTGSLSVTIVNLNAAGVIVTARLVPREADGSYSELGARTASVNVNPVPTIFSSVSADRTEIESGGKATVSWASPYVSAVNLNLTCQDGVTVISAGQTLACDRIAFPSDLGANTSVALEFTNERDTAKQVKIIVLPSVSAGTYDGTRAGSVLITVKVPVPKVPKISLTLRPPASLVSGGTFTLAWAGENIAGTNLIVPCLTGLTATSSVNPAEILACGKYAFSTNLPLAATTTFSLFNIQSFSLDATLKLIPAITTQTYDVTRAIDVLIRVLPAGSKVAPLPSPPPPPPASAEATAGKPPALSAPAPTPVPAPAPAPPGIQPVKISITQSLRRDMQNDEVTSLQEFLAKDPALYPEGLVTGYFGPATERALQRFQKKYGIASAGTPATTGYGLVGPSTRAKLNELMPGLPKAAPPTPAPQPSAPLERPSAPTAVLFSKALSRGSRGEEVSRLQAFLAKDSTLYPEGLVSGYYGPATDRALKRFQEKHGIARAGEPGYGLLGPKTRAKLNELAR